MTGLLHATALAYSAHMYVYILLHEVLVLLVSFWYVHPDLGMYVHTYVRIRAYTHTVRFS